MKKYYLLIFCALCYLSVKGHSQSIAIGFYNCENLYDTLDDAHVMDQPFTPKGQKKYTSQVYKEKIQHIAYVVSKLNTLKDKTPLALLGLAEIENKKVLEDIIHDSTMQNLVYKYIHFDSKDYRGIDVALLYQPSLFIPYQLKNFNLYDSVHFNKYQTRDILWVKGKLLGNWVSILVNHWPSRRNQNYNTEKDRIWAATRCNQIMDSLLLVDSETPFIVMGDFNDNPTDKSIRTLALTNPFLPLFKQGRGSLVFSGHWFLFDQILYSSALKHTDLNLSSCKPIVYNDNNLTFQYGIRRSQPFATYIGNQIQGGYSDHLPVAIIFTLKNAKNALK